MKCASTSLNGMITEAKNDNVFEVFMLIRLVNHTFIRGLGPELARSDKISTSVTQDPLFYSMQRVEQP